MSAWAHGMRGAPELTRADVERRLGADWVAGFFRGDLTRNAIAAEVRMHGAWCANEPEAFEGYAALARLIRMHRDG